MCAVRKGENSCVSSQGTNRSHFPSHCLPRHRKNCCKAYFGGIFCSLLCVRHLSRFLNIVFPQTMKRLIYDFRVLRECVVCAQPSVNYTQKAINFNRNHCRKFSVPWFPELFIGPMLLPSLLQELSTARSLTHNCGPLLQKFSHLWPLVRSTSSLSKPFQPIIEPGVCTVYI